MLLLLLLRLRLQWLLLRGPLRGRRTLLLLLLLLKLRRLCVYICLLRLLRLR